MPVRPLRVSSKFKIFMIELIYLYCCRLAMRRNTRDGYERCALKSSVRLHYRRSDFWTYCPQRIRLAGNQRKILPNRTHLARRNRRPELAGGCWRRARRHWPDATTRPPRRTRASSWKTTTTTHRPIAASTWPSPSTPWRPIRSMRRHGKRRSSNVTAVVNWTRALNITRCRARRGPSRSKDDDTWSAGRVRRVVRSAAGTRWLRRDVRLHRWRRGRGPVRRMLTMRSRSTCRWRSVERCSSRCRNVRAVWRGVANSWRGRV